MSERLAFEVGESKERVFDRAGWRCEVCGRPILDLGTPQLGHRIAQSKANMRKYGPEIIHHPLNMAATCSLDCNGRVAISKPGDVGPLVDRILAAIDSGEK